MAAKKENEKPLTLSQLTDFYNELIEPRFQKIENKIEKVEGKVDDLSDEVHAGFDDLYKKLATELIPWLTNAYNQKHPLKFLRNSVRNF